MKTILNSLILTLLLETLVVPGYTETISENRYLKQPFTTIENEALFLTRLVECGLLTIAKSEIPAIQEYLLSEQISESERLVLATSLLTFYRGEICQSNNAAQAHILQQVGELQNRTEKNGSSQNNISGITENPESLFNPVFFTDRPEISPELKDYAIALIRFWLTAAQMSGPSVSGMYVSGGSSDSPSTDQLSPKQSDHLPAAGLSENRLLDSTLALSRILAEKQPGDSRIVYYNVLSMLKKSELAPTPESFRQISELLDNIESVITEKDDWYWQCKILQITSARIHGHLEEASQKIAELLQQSIPAPFAILLTTEEMRLLLAERQYQAALRLAQTPDTDLLEQKMPSRDTAFSPACSSVYDEYDVTRIQVCLACRSGNEKSDHELLEEARNIFQQVQSGNNFYWKEQATRLLTQSGAESEHWEIMETTAEEMYHRQHLAEAIVQYDLASQKALDSQDRDNAFRLSAAAAGIVERITRERLFERPEYDTGPEKSEDYWQKTAFDRFYILARTFPEHPMADQIFLIAVALLREKLQNQWNRLFQNAKNDLDTTEAQIREFKTTADWKLYRQISDEFLALFPHSEKRDTFLLETANSDWLFQEESVPDRLEKIDSSSREAVASLSFAALFFDSQIKAENRQQRDNDPDTGSRLIVSSWFLDRFFARFSENVPDNTPDSATTAPAQNYDINTNNNQTPDNAPLTPESKAPESEACLERLKRQSETLNPEATLTTWTRAGRLIANQPDLLTEYDCLALIYAIEYQIRENTLYPQNFRELFLNQAVDILYTTEKIIKARSSSKKSDSAVRNRQSQPWNTDYSWQFRHSPSSEPETDDTTDIQTKILTKTGSLLFYALLFLNRTDQVLQYSKTLETLDDESSERVLSEVLTLAQTQSPENRKQTGNVCLRVISSFQQNSSNAVRNFHEPLEYYESRALILTGQNQKAVDLLGRLHKEYPDDIAIMEEIALLLSTQNDSRSLNLALDYWNKIAIRSRDGSPLWWKTKEETVLLYYQLGNTEQVRKIMEYLKLTCPNEYYLEWENRVRGRMKKARNLF